MSDVAERLSTAVADRYEIERELGAGGMATVYLAHDVKHDRKVALKVLRPELAAVIGAERFLQEIKVTANLQHPHILALHDSGEADGFLFYVMPFVDGENLRDKLDREKQLSIEDAVGITQAIGSALEYAHERGVIHRDIKPENILIHAGQPVVADFGIALAVSAAGGTRLTETGLSLGTPHYMSPEQAMGDRELDARSDIYSLGCMVYEMLVGEPPYTGPTAQAIVAKVITEEPRQLTLLRRTVPPHVEAAVHKSLQKLPADRFDSAANFIDALTNPAFATAITPAGKAWLTGVLGLVALVAVALALWGWLRPIPAPVTRVSISLPEEEALQPAPTIRFVLSRDGSRVVYTGPGDNGHQLWVRELDALRARPLPGTDDAQALSLSPDGMSVAFTDANAGSLRVVPIDGGPARTIVNEAVSPWGTDWGSDGMIYFSGQNGGLRRVPADGGPVEALSEPDSARGISEHDWPQLLPGARAALVAEWRGAVSDVVISAVVLETGEVRPIADAVYARFLEPNHLILATSDGTLSVAPFDVERLELTGPPRAIVEGIRIESNSGAAEFSVSGSGTLIYQGGSAIKNEVVWIDREGTSTPMDSTWRADIGTLALSPDGTRLAVSIIDTEGEHIWVKQLDRGPLTRLTFDGGQNYRPAWSVDGRDIVFLSNRTTGQREIWIKRADGSAPAELLIHDVRPLDEVEPVGDGESFVFRRGSGGVNTRDLAVIRPGIDTVATSLVETRFDDYAPALSPDGRWLAYVANESGSQDVYVRPFPETASARWQVSVGGGSEPLWAPSGRELFYRTRSGGVMAVAVTPGPTFAYGTPQLLFSDPGYETHLYHSLWDVSSNGERFVMVRREGAERSDLVLVLNWRQELERAR